MQYDKNGEPLRGNRKKKKITDYRGQLIYGAITKNRQLITYDGINLVYGTICFHPRHKKIAVVK